MEPTDFISVEELSEEQWDQIRQLAKQIHETKNLNFDLVRSSVCAFVLWISENDKGLAVDIPEEKPKKKQKKVDASRLN